jgi:protein involved in polysaccharide export with SLBB domain
MPDAAARPTVPHSPLFQRASVSAIATGFLRIALAAVLPMVFLATSVAANAQTPSTPPSDAADNPASDSQQNGATPASELRPDSAGSSRSVTEPGAPPASPAPTFREIVGVLQQNPDLIVELKSLVAEKMEEQGTELSPNDITDEMLYGQIAANANLRMGIVAFLRARGYLSADDLEDEASGSAEEGTGAATSSLLPLQRLPYSTFAEALQEGSATDSDRQAIEGTGLSALAAQSTGHTRNGREAPPVQTRREETESSTDPPKTLRQPAPYNLQSMRDLYTQIPDQTAPLRRFGSEVFINRDTGSAALGIAPRDTPLDVPLGPDYIVGPGDALTVDLWGGVTESFTRAVDRDGRVLLPDTEPVQVAGLPLSRAQDLIESALKRQYRNAQIAVTVSRLRSVRVYVVGDVQCPGGYDISSLATPLSALYAAGGPTSVGSLRTLLHYRGKQLVETVDLYDFLLHGVRNGSARFESGDTLLVPPAGAQIAIFGAVRRPAIYELKTGESTLASVIDDAGGLTAAAAPGNLRIERIGANHQRETVTANLAGESNAGESRNALAEFSVMDGDRIRIEPVLPYSQRAVYLEGHVVRPGRLPYVDGMRLSDVLRSYRDMLPEPAARGEIVRLVSPDLHAETIEFNVPDVLIGNANTALEPYDTVRIFGRYEADAPKVTVLGEVLRPGVYPMSAGMTAAQLVRMAGGFKRDALLDSADLTSYSASGDEGVVGSLAAIRIGAAVSGTDADTDVVLKPGDTLMIHQMTGWNDIGQSVSIQGQVKFPGSYGFEEGEHLSSVLRRAGGFLPTAYSAGAVLVRVQVRDLEQKSRDELIRQIETNSAAARLSPSLAAANADTTLQQIKAQQDEVISELRNHPPSGRMVIQITSDIDSWANTDADIELRRGDIVTIPKRPGFVLVTGQVYNSTALAFTPDKTAGWYLSRAGGANVTANRKEIFVIRANGSVVGRRSSGWFEGDVLSTRLNPGDVVVVPQKIVGSSQLWRNLLSAGQIAASVAITAGVAAATL